MHGFSRRNVIRDFVLLLAGSTVATARQSVARDMPLAIKGYDPVAYFTDGMPKRGLPDFEYQWDEHRYRFASAEHRDLFKADPVRYAPEFANYCAMSLAQGMIVEADPENWLISDGKLYIFGKSIGPELFEKDLAANVARANRNRALIRQH
jgi:hypothetical protein